VKHKESQKSKCKNQNHKSKFKEKEGFRAEKDLCIINKILHFDM